MKAKVYKSTGSWYQVKAENGQFYNARAKGVFKIEGHTSTNPIAVGDDVDIEIEAVQEESAIIQKIHDRRNYVARVSPHNKRMHHIIASNMDQSLLFATLKEPKTSTGFIDRFLISCEAYHIPAILVFNKADLYKAKEMERFEMLKEIYTNAGYTVMLITSSGLIRRLLCRRFSRYYTIEKPEVEISIRKAAERAAFLWKKTAASR